LEDVVLTLNGVRGMEIHNDTIVSDLEIKDCEFISNGAQGLRTASNVIVDGMTITDSKFNGNSYGIYLQGTINGVTILRSEFNNSVGGYGGYNNAGITIRRTSFQNNDKWGALIWGNTLTDVLIEESKVLNNNGLGEGYYGIYFGTDADLMTNVAVHNSSITGHTVGGGVKNRNAVDTAIVDATCNWWGDASGPTHADNPLGTGNAVSDYVEFTPWLIGMAPGGLCIGGTPKGSKVSVVSDLSALLPTGDKKTDHCIEKAIEHIQRSLNIDPKHPEKEPEHPIWLDETTLDPKHGKKVFDEEKKAVKELEHIIKDKKAAQDVKDACQAAIDALVAADKALAQTAIEEAIEAGGDPKEIAKAQDEMTKAQEELDHTKKDGIPDPRYDKAIDHYKKAWEHACKPKKTQAVEIEPLAVPDEVTVVAYPNPIRDVHTATFQVMGTLAAEVEEIRVQIYDLSGHLVWEDAAPGYELNWHTDSLSGEYLANGIYLYRVQVRIGGSWINQDIGKIAGNTKSEV
jgi:hypothetical protein